MSLAPSGPAALSCPRCTGPMFRAASDALDYICLLCGECRFLAPRRAPLSERLVADLAAKRRRSGPRFSRYRRCGSIA